MGSDRTSDATDEAQTVSLPRSQTSGASFSPHWHPVCVEDWNPMEHAAPRDGLWLWQFLLETPESMATGWCMAETPRGVACQTPWGRQARLVQSDRRQLIHPCGARGKKTGPSPTDRRKAGSKHHVITDAQGIPLAGILTAANVNDVTQLIPLVDAIPPIRGEIGRPRQKPLRVQGDRGYDAESNRRALRTRGIEPVIAKRNTEHGSGLGVTRWVIERTHAWLHQNRRLRIRYERLPEIHQAFFSLACAMICWHFL
jgi:transposase